MSFKSGTVEFGSGVVAGGGVATFGPSAMAIATTFDALLRVLQFQH